MLSLPHPPSHLAVHLLLATASAGLIGGKQSGAAEPVTLITPCEEVEIPPENQCDEPFVEPPLVLPAPVPFDRASDWSCTTFDPYRHNRPPKRLLPIWGDEARKRGYEIPLPLGAALVGVWTEEKFVVKEVRLGAGGAPPVPANFLSLTNGVGEVRNVTARFDAWLFPFMNIYGLIGYSEGQSSGILNVSPASPVIPGFSTPVVVDIEGPMYGVGTTLVYGNERFLALVDLAYTNTDLNISDTDVSATIITPRAGMHRKFGEMRGAAWIGAMFRDVDERLVGTVNIPTLGGPISVEVVQESTDPWNFLVGGQWEFTEHFQIVSEVGMGDGYIVVLSAMARF